MNFKNSKHEDDAIAISVFKEDAVTHFAPLNVSNICVCCNNFRGEITKHKDEL